MELRDEFGKVTRFSGVHLVCESTEGDDRPQWIEMDVWRTYGGSFVVRSRTHYRIRHVDEQCSRFGLNLVPRAATDEDTWPCPKCDPHEVLGRYGVATRCSIDVADSPADLIHSMKDQQGKISNFKRYVLAQISEQDSDVHELWMNVNVA